MVLEFHGITTIREVISMRPLTRFIVTVVFALMGTPPVLTAQGVPGEGSCISCYNFSPTEQRCQSSASGGSACNLYVTTGGTYCSTSGAPCGGGYGFSPLTITPAGTVAAADAVRRANGALTTLCGEYLVTRRPASETVQRPLVRGDLQTLVTSLRPTNADDGFKSRVIRI